MRTQDLLKKAAQEVVLKASRVLVDGKRVPVGKDAVIVSLLGVVELIESSTLYNLLFLPSICSEDSIKLGDQPLRASLIALSRTMQEAEPMHAFRVRLISIGRAILTPRFGYCEFCVSGLNYVCQNLFT